MIIISRNKNNKITPFSSIEAQKEVLPNFTGVQRSDSIYDVNSTVAKNPKPNHIYSGHHYHQVCSPERPLMCSRKRKRQRTPTLTKHYWENFQLEPRKAAFY